MNVVEGEELADVIKQLAGEAAYTDYPSDWKILHEKIDKLKGKIIIDKKELQDLFNRTYDEWFKETELGHDVFVGFNYAIKKVLGEKEV